MGSNCPWAIVDGRAAPGEALSTLAVLEGPGRPDSAAERADSVVDAVRPSPSTFTAIGS
jgi:hypothetical protein